MDDIRSAMDAVSSERAVLLGPAGWRDDLRLLFAASFPE